MSTIDNSENNNGEVLDKKTLEEKRREARKARIQNNTKNRMGYIYDHVDSLKEDPKKEQEPIIQDKSDDETEIYNNNKPTADNSLPTIQGFNLENILKKTRYVREPFSFRASRFIGAIMFSLILVSLTILPSSQKLLSDIQGSHQSTRQLWNMVDLVLWNFRAKLFFLFAFGSSWLLWEAFIVYMNKSYTSQVSKSPLLSYLSRDLMLLLFFYTVGVDASLRYLNQNHPGYALDGELVSGLYIPLLVAFIGQLVVKQIPKYIEILNNDLFNKIYTLISHIVMVIFILILCIDEWTCTSVLCKSGFLWLLTSKSRGLMLWSHICLNFVSTLLN
ncbi:putative transmembrane protein [Tieghemostelium lacteum]|uniref:Putative transmembrane protein n=1 Tax=Tieghemostelium lacteum TaxID=361077 RepID=A0A152A9W8_TIELA|nr:putative transmembrane protein [Tieghemostelium lacteum]|eukprot:KYR03004.1 putative transmembrane protein [Tieghemostelium lacteum]